MSKDEILSDLSEWGGYFCRYTSDFDCNNHTEWWYCLKDEIIDLQKLTSKQRYRIKRGNKNCEIFKIEQLELEQWLDDMFSVQETSFSEYPEKYRPKADYEAFKVKMKGWKGIDIWGATDRETRKLIAYAIIKKQKDMVWLTALKVHPKFMNTDVNAAMVYSVCNHYLGGKCYKYVCDGERNIRHETNFQEFLVHNLNFRYAYCRLHVVYKPIVGIIVRLLMPFREFIRRIGHYNKYLYNLWCVLRQEEIARSCKN